MEPVKKGGVLTAVVRIEKAEQAPVCKMDAKVGSKLYNSARVTRLAAHAATCDNPGPRGQGSNIVSLKCGLKLFN